MNSFWPRPNLYMPLALLVAASLACSLGGGSESTGETDLAGTEAALSATQAALEAALESQEGEAEEAAPPTAVSQDQSDALATPTDVPFFVEEFDFWDASNWAYWLVQGDDEQWDLYAENGALVFDIGGEDLWAYLTYEEYTYTDIRIDVQVKNVGSNNNNVSLICREGPRGWYEFNIANNGLYWILRYDEQTGDYVQLYNGGSESIRTGKDTNQYTAICDGTQLALYINGVETRVVSDQVLDDGYAGISVSSFEFVPVIVEFEWLQFSPPG